MKRFDAITDERWAKVNEFNRNLVDEYIENSTELSPKTKKVYRSNLMIFFVYVCEHLKNKTLLELKPLDYKKFQNYLMNEHRSSADISNKRAAISSICKYVEVFYADTYPTFRNFINSSVKRPPRAFVNEKKPLTKAEFQHLIDVLTEQGEKQKIAYLEFSLASGCRRAEVRQLLKSDVYKDPVVKRKKYVDEKGTECEREIVYYVTSPKRCKGRGEVGKMCTLVYSERAHVALINWLEARGVDDCPYVFVTKDKDGMAGEVNETTFNDWCKTFEPIVGRRMHPHILRESAATQAVVEDGKDINAVKALLHHSALETTNIYIVRDESEDSDDLF